MHLALTLYSTNIIVLIPPMLMEVISESLCVHIIRTSHDNATEEVAWKLPQGRQK